MFRVQDSETITLDRIKEATVNFNIAIQDIFVGEGGSATSMTVYIIKVWTDTGW